MRSLILVSILLKIKLIELSINYLILLSHIPNFFDEKLDVIKA